MFIVNQVLLDLKSTGGISQKTAKSIIRFLKVWNAYTKKSTVRSVVNSILDTLNIT